MRSNALIYIMSIILAMFIGWYLFNPNFSSVIEYMLMLVFFVLIAWFILIYFVHNQKERGYLISLFIVALALRMIISMLVHALLPPGYFAPDEIGILWNGKMIAESLSGNEYFTVSIGGNYIWYFAGLIFYIFGYKPNLLFLFVNFLGAMTVLNVYFITKRLFNEQSARYSAAVATLLPSLVLWASMPTKDPYSQFLITAIVHLTLKVKERFSISNIMLIIGFIALIGFVRGYLLIIVLMAVASVFIPFRKETFLRNVLITTIFAMSFAVFFSSFAAKQAPKYGQKSENVLETMQQTRGAFYQGGSKMLGNVNVANPVDALMYSPLLLTVFFLAPFPWDITGSILHNLATSESLIWYFFLYYAIKGIARSLKEGNFDSIPVIVMIGVLSVAYAFAITNLGATYRFRAQVSVLFLVFTGYGLYLRNQERIRKYSMPVGHKEQIKKPG